ncbi:dynamin-related protein 4C [Lactuca sativa]|uniref:dynamin-related protein 4C n=1 Tax=Lactuca sativa TaxID=4236 RepID=UPI000CB90182|nr:dynamin-related protein 4C [Lactuca sativa]
MALTATKSSASKSSSKRRNYSSSDSDDDYSSVVDEGASGTLDLHHTVPLVSKYDDRIRPLLNCVDNLRHLKVMQEGIQLPTIVVVGDQSSGKSSVLESLARISLPRAQGICTRVPLIMRLQHHADPRPQLHLEYNNKSVVTDETRIEEDIIAATDEIAGNGKGISHTPLTLIVKKRGVPDLTMVDLPGITRVPVHGQPEDIYEQISAIITEYITPEESIILNVLSVSVDFSTCESIRMSQRVDVTGQRTLAVVTKADKNPEGLLEKVTSNDVNVGLGYICVRNRVGKESYEEARIKEAKLFETHPLLSLVDKSMVGVPVLAEKLVEIQSTIISKCLPDIVTKINEKLTGYVDQLNKLPRKMTSVAEAMTAFMRIIGSVKESLRKILIRGEFEEYPDVKSMHGTARLSEMLNEYFVKLQATADNEGNGFFLMEEIRVLEEAKGIGLPNFLPRAAFLTILNRRVNGISRMPVEFVGNLWHYIEDVLISVLLRHSENYPPLQSSMRRSAHNLMAKIKAASVNRVIEMVEMEKMTDYTCNPEYTLIWQKLMSHEQAFVEAIIDHSKSGKINIEGLSYEVEHLRKYGVDVVKQAFDMKMRMIAYWKIVLRRMVDCMALHMLFSIQNLINRDMEVEILEELMAPHGGGIERMLEEAPMVAGKRDKLNRSIKLLRDSKEVVANVIDQIAAYGD